MATTHEIVVREIPDVTTNHPQDVAEHVLPIIGYRDREFFLTLVLDTKNHIVHTEIVSIGSLSANLTHPREVFKPAITRGGAAVIVAHNHPSGDVTPSREDKAYVERIEKAGEVLGIRVLDSVIVGPKGQWWSMTGQQGGELQCANVA